MIRPNWNRLRSSVRKVLHWRARRELRRRPGHFRIRRKKTRLLTRVPWRRLISAHPIAVATLLTTIAFGWVMIDAETVGADARQIAQEVERGRPAPPPLPESTSMYLQGKVALLLQIAMLQESIDRLEGISTYTTNFTKTERIDGTLSGEQTMSLKMQHRPFSVYFKVEAGKDLGREILFPMSDDDPRMLVQMAKLGGRLPALKLDPNSTLAMSEARYPITMAGINELTKMALEIRQRDLTLADRIQIELRDDRTFDGRSVYAWSIEYPSSTLSEIYRRCEMQIDKQLMLPVFVRNWTWPEKVAGADLNDLDGTTLIESYAFRDIKLEAGLDPTHFASDHPDYRFR